MRAAGVAIGVALVVALGGLSAAVGADPVTAAARYSTPASVDFNGLSSSLALGDEVCPGQPVGPALAERIAWDEIAELAAIGVPACDASWSFGPQESGFGHAQFSTRTISMESTLDIYLAAGDARLEIVSTVRHEIGHILLSEHGLDAEDEILTEAVGVALSAARGDRYSLYYVDRAADIPVEQQGAADALAGHFTG